MVSWGPDSCNPDDTGDINSRNPDVYTDVRFYKSWIEEETSDLGDPFDEVADSTQQLAPNCGGSNCFRAHDGACSFIESPFFQCNDKIFCDLHENIPFLTTGKQTSFASPSAGIGSTRARYNRRRRCVKWALNKATNQWRCVAVKMGNSAVRQRRQTVSLDESATLVCPVLSCQSKMAIPDQYTSLLQTTCVVKEDDTICDREKRETCLDANACPGVKDLRDGVADSKSQITKTVLQAVLNDTLKSLVSCGQEDSYCCPSSDRGLSSDPCNPSPCGSLGRCRIVQDQAMCACQEGYEGLPPDCHDPGACNSNSDCKFHEACFSGQCLDPCTRTLEYYLTPCGTGARCSVLNHLSSCACEDGSVGNPFEKCNSLSSTFTKLLVTTGFSEVEGGSIASTEIIDLRTNSRCRAFVDDYPHKYYGVVTGTVLNLPVVVCGGCASHCSTISSECYALTSQGQWRPFKNLTIERGGAAALFNNDHGYHIFGGLGTEGRLESLESFSEDQDNWIKEDPRSNMPTSVFGHCVVALNETTFMLIGGRRSNSSRYSELTHFYDTRSSTWSFGPHLRVGRRYAACGVIKDPESGQEAVIVAGGWDGETVQKSTEILDLDQPHRAKYRWSRGPDLPMPLTNMATVQRENSFGNSILIVGGDETAVEKGGESDRIYELSSTRGPWRQLEQTLQVPRSAHVALLVPDDAVFECA